MDLLFVYRLARVDLSIEEQVRDAGHHYFIGHFLRLPPLFKAATAALVSQRAAIEGKMLDMMFRAFAAASDLLP